MKKIFFGLLLVIVGLNGFGQGWIKKQNFPTIYENIVNLSIGNKGYTLTPLREFWEFNPESNSWIRRANFPGKGMKGVASFSIGNKGFIGTGVDRNLVNEFWEWDQQTDTWRQISNFPGHGKVEASGFSIGNKGYLVGGLDFETDNPELWEWDQMTDSWSQKSQLPVRVKQHGISFSIGSYGYYGIGDDSCSTHDFWEWDQISDTWNKKADFPGGNRTYACGFSIDNKGYIALGISDSTCAKDLWEWNQNSNTWNQLEDFPGIGRYEAIGFAISGKIYLGGGRDRNFNSYPKDFWEYDPAFPTGVKQSYENSTLIIPNPTQGKFSIQASSNSKISIYDILGICVSTSYTNDNNLEIDLSSKPKGLYFVKISSENENEVQKVVIN